MARAVVLLRGVNVGSARRVPMAVFAQVLRELGATEVRTVLNSGNAVVQAPRQSPALRADAIAQGLLAATGHEVPVLVRSERDFRAALADRPWREVPDPSRLLLTWAPDAEALHALAGLTPLLAPGERWHLGSQAACLQVAGPLLESRAAAALMGPAHRRCTSRNWATALRLQAALDALAA